MFKNIFLFFILVSLSFSINAQTAACKKFRYGTFRMITEGKSVIVKRYGNMQEETVEGANFPKMVFTVKWLNDCSYELTPTATTRKSYPEMPKIATMTATILKTTANSYLCSSVFSFDKTKVFKSQLTLLK